MEVSGHVTAIFLGTLSLSAFLLPTAAKARDNMCSNIAEFAASSESGQSHSIVLRGGWGGDTKETLMTHECLYSGFAPGKKLCAYLLPHSSWEFGQHNAERAVACLDSGDRKEFLDQLNSKHPDAEITSSLRLLKDPDVRVTLHYEQPGGASISVLTIFVIRNDAK